MSVTTSSSGESGGYRIFTGESEDYLEYRRALDKLDKANYGSYVFTCLGGKALEAVEHLDPSVYQKVGGEDEILSLLDKRFPEKEKTDEMAEILGQIFNLRAKDGDNSRMVVSKP